MDTDKHGWGRESRTLALEGADVRLYADCFTANEAADLVGRLTDGLDWRREHLRMFGRRVQVPRLVAWYGDAGYRYSGLDHPARPWTPLLIELKARCEAVAGAEFNGVLANLYRCGADSMGWHADDEPELGPAPVIASLSLGAPRRFQFRRRDDHRCRLDLVLEPGSLLVMAGATQRLWQHRLPKTRAATGPRVNLTFRRMG